MIGEKVSFEQISKKTVGVGAEVMSGGRLLQSYQPLKTHEMLTVDIRVRQITSCEDDDDR